MSWDATDAFTDLKILMFVIRSSGILRDGVDASLNLRRKEND
jgi:hypothetical protein